MGLRPSEFSGEVKSLGMQWEHFPISDKWVPHQGQEEFAGFVNMLVGRLRRGEHVVVHCNGGKGRSSLVAAATLNVYSASIPNCGAQSLRESMAVVREGAAGTLKNPVQRAFLMRFALYNGTRVFSCRRGSSHAEGDGAELTVGGAGRAE